MLRALKQEIIDADALGGGHVLQGLQPLGADAKRRVEKRGYGVRLALRRHRQVLVDTDPLSGP